MSNELETIDTILARLKESQNGERPAAMRDLGAALAGLDVPTWVDVKAGLSKRSGMKAADLVTLRSDGLKRKEEQARADKEEQTRADKEAQERDQANADEASRARGALAAAAAGETEAKPGYVVSQGVAGTPMLCYRKMTADGPIIQTLARFVPVVIGERVRHRADGTHTRVIMCELATARGTIPFDALPEDLADAKRFYAACVHAIGADAKLAFAKARDHLPLAAFDLSDDKRNRSELFEFVGWHEHNGHLVYLSAGGAIGTNEALTVDLSGLAAGTGFPALANFGPRDDGNDALSIAMIAMAGPVRKCLGDDVMLPQLAAVGLAPLLRWAPIGELPVLHMMGATGKGKTRAARVLQAFYGLDKPGASWGWTQAAIEVVSSALRDCVVCIDDLKSSTCDPRIAVRTMQRWADRRPRVRSNRSGSGLIGSPHIASLMLSNGEDLPAGEASVVARALFIPVWEEAFNEDAFRQAEAVLDALPTLTARYIGWLIQEEAALLALIGETFHEARRRYHRYLAGKTRINDAGRVASSCALLETGAAIMTQFLQKVGWGQVQAAEWMAATRCALEDLALGQASMIDEESAARLFLSSIAALLDCHEVELQPVEVGKTCPLLVDCNTKQAGARLIGWKRGDEVLLDMGLVLPAVREWLRRQGVSQGLEKHGLYTQLRSGKYLARWDAKQVLVVQKMDGGSTKRVLALKEASLRDLEEPVQLVAAL